MVAPAVTSSIEQYKNAQQYLKSLKKGVKPPFRPDCGRWNPIVADALAMFERYEQLQERANYVTHLLDGYVQTGNFPGLEELLSDAPDQEDHHQYTTQGQQSDSDQKMPPLPEEARLSEELSKGACPTGDEYIQYSKLASPEGFEGFHVACFLWMLSVIAARRIVIPLGKGIYTPLYIILCAWTSLYKKSTTADVAKETLRKANLGYLLGADRTTPEKLMGDMSGTLPRDYGDFDEEKKARTERRYAMSGQRGWYYDEFGKFVKAMLKSNGTMDGFADLLLQLDNCTSTYEYATQSRGSEIIEKPYLALLGSMTPASIKATSKSGAEFWGDGFWARFAFVTAPKDAGLDNPFDEGLIEMPYSISHKLSEWHQRLGVPQAKIDPIKDEKGKDTGRYKPSRDPLPETQVKLGPDVRNAWARYRSALKKISATQNNDFDGSYDRLPTIAIRIAGLIGSLENNNLIELKHWAWAQEVTEQWRAGLHELYEQVNTAGVSVTTQLENDIVAFMSKRGGKAKTRDMIREGTPLMRRTKASAYEDIMRYLIKNEIVKEVRDPGSRKVSYELI